MSTCSDGGARTALVRLRPYQMEAIAGIDRCIAAGTRRVLVVAPTGAGKTSCAAYFIEREVRAGKRIIFLAHRRELIGQTHRQLGKIGLDPSDVGVIMANDPRRRPGARVQVASIDTLRHRAKPHADVVFVDECHRALAASYKNIAAAYPNAIHIGLTATPYRADGRGLGEAYDEMVVVARPKQLIADGYLVQPRMFTVPPHKMPDLSGVTVRRGDYDERQLAEALNKKVLVGNIVEHWMQRAQGMRTVAFASSVEHSKHIVERFREACVPAEHLDGMTPTAERDAILARLDRGETRVVSNCSVLQEGWDQPSVKCCILARPTKSLGLYIQQAGRILRPFENLPAIILDHAGCWDAHKSPEDDREFSLDTRKKTCLSPGVAPTKLCTHCDAVVPAACRTCPECNTVLFTVETTPQEEEGALVPVEDLQADQERAERIEWERLTMQAAARGYKPGWAVFRFKERFGHAPPSSSPDPIQHKPPPGAQTYVRMLMDEPSVAWAALRYRVEYGEPPPDLARPLSAPEVPF